MKINRLSNPVIYADRVLSVVIISHLCSKKVIVLNMDGYLHLMYWIQSIILFEIFQIKQNIGVVLCSKGKQ